MQARLARTFPTVPAMPLGRCGWPLKSRAKSLPNLHPMCACVFSLSPSHFAHQFHFHLSSHFIPPSGKSPTRQRHNTPGTYVHHCCPKQHLINKPKYLSISRQSPSAQNFNSILGLDARRPLAPTRKPTTKKTSFPRLETTPKVAKRNGAHENIKFQLFQ